MLVCMAAWALLCTSTAAQSSTGGGGGGCSCDTTVSPLPSEVSIAIGVHVNASVGVISEDELAALGPDHSTFASLVNPILQGLHLYVADMRAQGAAMPLTNGNNVTFKFVWVNFGGLNLASVERLDAKGKADYLQLADTLSDPVASVALGGPFPFIIAPLFSPEDLHGEWHDSHTDAECGQREHRAAKGPHTPVLPLCLFVFAFFFVSQWPCLTFAKTR